MLDSILNIHRFLHASYTNGPGCRAVIWVQGCTLACPGCFNPKTHSINHSKAVSTQKLFKQIVQVSAGLEGLTISGGEPLQQAAALVPLLRKIRATMSLSVILFTGFEWNQIAQVPGGSEVASLCDVVIAGRYQQEKRVASGLLGSANKTFHFLTTRYAQSDFLSIPEAEVILEPNGEILLSGINPLQW